MRLTVSPVLNELLRDNRLIRQSWEGRLPPVCLGQIGLGLAPGLSCGPGYTAKIMDTMKTRAENRCNSIDLLLNEPCSLFRLPIPKSWNNYP